MAHDENQDEFDDNNEDADVDLGGAPVLIIWVVLTSTAGVGPAPGEDMAMQLLGS